MGPNSFADEPKPDLFTIQLCANLQTQIQLPPSNFQQYIDKAVRDYELLLSEAVLLISWMDSSSQMQAVHGRTCPVVPTIVQIAILVAA